MGARRGGARRLALLLLIAVAAVLSAGAASAGAHAGLVRSDPGAGATLGASPAAVRLTFSEQPAARLSDIVVRDARGVVQPTPRPVPSHGDPASLATALPRLGRGVYTVSWRGVSAVDGHATSGTFAFGVGERPSAAAAHATSTSPGGSALEILARWLLLAGLVALLGSAAAAVAGFAPIDGDLTPNGGVKSPRSAVRGRGGPIDGELWLATGGVLVALVGFGLLFEAQRRAAGASASELMRTPVGDALVERAMALAVVAAAVLVAVGQRSWPRRRRAALGVAGGGALAAILAHVAAGHAGAGSWPAAISIGVQTAHFAAAGVWIGGLGALLLAIRGAASAAKAEAVRRFSAVAAIGIAVVALAGTLRAVDELAGWSDLWSSGYGRVIVAKVALLALIAALATRSRRRARGGQREPGAAESRGGPGERGAEERRGGPGERGVAEGRGGPGEPGAAERRYEPGSADEQGAGVSLAALRRTSGGELVLAVAAIALAAVLGAVAPPVAGQASAPGLTANAADDATTTRVKLTAASAEPGANRFVARVTDYDSGKPVRGAGVRLRFEPLDDPGVDATSLALAPQRDGDYAGTGANLAFDGRWRVTALVQSGTDAAEIPLELDVPGPEHFVSTFRARGLPTQYTAQIIGGGYIRITPDPDRAGPSTVTVEVFTLFENEATIDVLTLTARAGRGPVRQRPVRRRGPGRFTAPVSLAGGANEIAVVARDREGTRLRAVFDVVVSG